MFEFAMAFPIFLSVVLMFIQWVLILNARVIVNYSAFCAARSAAVWIPAQLEGENPNTMAAQGSEKLGHIRGAAAIACIPISPKILHYFRDLSDDFLIRLLAPGDPYRTNPLLRVGRAAEDESEVLRELDRLAQTNFISQSMRESYERIYQQYRTYAAIPGQFLDAIDALLPRRELLHVLQKYAYSKVFTDVELEGGPDFQPTQMITVKVTHPFYLNVPFARRIFGERLGTRYYDRTIGALDPALQPFVDYLFSKSQMYAVDIQESCTIINEGEDTHLPE